MIRRLSTLFFLSFLITSSGISQKTNSFQNWFDYTQINKINGNWSYLGDYAFRFQVEDSDSKWWLLQVRPSVIFKNKALYDIRGGIMLRYTGATSGDSFEFRPWQGFKLNWPNFGRFRFNNLVRTEQRFSVDLETDVSNFVFKLRYKLYTNIPINNPIITSKTYYVSIGFEIFSDLGFGDNKEFIDDITRLDVGVGYRFNSKTDLRLRYILQKSKVNADTSSDSNDNIIRLSVIQRFGMN